jgi:hypothetical protein
MTLCIVDIEHALEARHGELLPLVQHRALAQHQHVQRPERRSHGFDRGEVRCVHLRIVQAGQVGAFVGTVGRCTVARAPDMHLGTAFAEGMGDAVADATGTADHQHGLAAEVQIVHGVKFPRWA